MKTAKIKNKESRKYPNLKTLLGCDINRPIDMDKVRKFLDPNYCPEDGDEDIAFGDEKDDEEAYVDAMDKTKLFSLKSNIRRKNNEYESDIRLKKL